nr:MAG: zinc-binding loop region of homing endonuclease [Bacteriophage sp.]
MKENIPGYHVTRDGKVYSCLIQGGSSKRGPWKLRHTAITKTGHEQIRLRTLTGFRSKGVHRLVALAYIPNPNNYPIVRHLDDIGTHNTVNNLRWGTQKDNVNDSIINGRHSMPPYGVQV